MEAPFKNVYVLKLKEIAAWQFPKLVGGDPDKLLIRVGIPSLQRGAVWKPAQIELIWDSIFRGFPVGALVVCDVLQDQIAGPGKHGKGWDQGCLNRHLLDGQQRCNAIALGFSDTFVGDSPDTMLWLDINRQKFTGAKITRQYSFRVTTQAHPWGYRIDDNTTPVATLAAEDVRTALAKYKWPMEPADENYQRPSVSKVWPSSAAAPVPVAWLLEAAEKLEGESFWQNILQRCESRLAQDNNAQWAGNAIEAIKARSPSLPPIEKGLRRALDLHVVALQVPNEAITEAFEQEEADAHITSGPKQDISSVEHLFQRLNRGGTVLDGPELAYSMIKAYMPGVETVLEDMEAKPMVYSSLALLGTRAALAQNQPDKLPTALNVGQLRALARDTNKKTEFDTVKRYFGLLPNTSDPGDPGLERVIIQVDKWLLWDSDTDRIGLPPVLRTNLAQKASDVYLLLMVLARRALHEHKESGQKLAALRRPVLGLATALHWFGDDRPQAVEKLYAHLACGPLVPESFSGVLQDVRDLGPDRHGVLQLLDPDALKTIITLPDKQNLSAWRWWKSLIEEPAKGEEPVRLQRQVTIWPFIERLKGSKDLLIYAQREWMAKRFGTFDPARPEALEDHNRPWDYDHITPQKSFNNLKPAPKFMDVCKQWGWTIANLHILRFEENRSMQAGLATEKISDDHLLLARMDSPYDLRPAFSLKRPDVYANDDGKVLKFVEGARDRLIQIYTDWFETLDISLLLGNKSSS
jgi:hypothetical protein